MNIKIQKRKKTKKKKIIKKGINFTPNIKHKTRKIQRGGFFPSIKGMFRARRTPHRSKWSALKRFKKLSIKHRQTKKLTPEEQYERSEAKKKNKLEKKIAKEREKMLKKLTSESFI
jgi:hypothetical protein